MNKSHFNLRYNSGLPIEYYKANSEEFPSTYAMAWCMQKAEVARIFTRDDLYEFFYRLPIIFHLTTLVENWLMEEVIITYFFNDKPYQLKLEDVIMHFGLEAFDHYINHTGRERYCIRAESSNTFARQVGYNAHFPMLRMEGHEKVIGKYIYPREITPEIKVKAEFFAGDIMKQIPEKTFTMRSRALIDKENELVIRQQRIDNLELFDMKKIPGDIIRRCLKKIFAEKDVIQLMGDSDEFKKRAKKMIYVGWVYANCFMQPDGSFSPERETFILDFMDFEIEGGGYHSTGRHNITYNYEFSDMDALAPLLKGIEAF